MKENSNHASELDPFRKEEQFFKRTKHQNVAFTNKSRKLNMTLMFVIQITIKSLFVFINWQDQIRLCR
jgi:hypothetical protein